MKQNNEQFLMWKMSQLLDEHPMWPERERVHTEKRNEKVELFMVVEASLMSISI